MSRAARASTRVGTQPSLVQVPPRLPRSMSATSAPSSRARKAAVTPAGPPPITTTSNMRSPKLLCTRRKLKRSTLSGAAPAAQAGGLGDHLAGCRGGHARGCALMAMHVVVRRTLHGYQRNVVLLFPASAGELRQRMQQAHNRGRAIAVPLQQLPQARQTEHLALGIVRLHQPVAVEEQMVAGRQYGLSLLVARARHETKRHARGVQLTNTAVVMTQVRQILARVGEAQPPALGFEDTIKVGHEHAFGNVSRKQIVHSCEDLSWRSRLLRGST